MQDGFVDIASAARLLGVTRQALYERITNNPGLPFIKKVMIEKILIDTSDPYFQLLQKKAIIKKSIDDRMERVASKKANSNSTD